MRVLCVCVCVCVRARARVCVCCVCAAFVRAFVRASAYCEHVVRASAYCEHVRLFRVRARVCACVRARSRQQRLRGWRRCCEGAALLRGCEGGCAVARAAAVARATAVARAAAIVRATALLRGGSRRAPALGLCRPRLFTSSGMGLAFALTAPLYDTTPALRQGRRAGVIARFAFRLARRHKSSEQKAARDSIRRCCAKADSILLTLGRRCPDKR